LNKSFSINEFKGTVTDLVKLLTVHGMVDYELSIVEIVVNSQLDPKTQAQTLATVIRNELQLLPIQQRHMIGAIKQYRQITNSSLKEAKDWCEVNLPEYAVSFNK